MTRKSVGYFEGTDSTLLTSLICAGFDTLPVSNGVDHHGKNVRRINQQEKYDILIGLHTDHCQPPKVAACPPPPSGSRVTSN